MTGRVVDESLLSRWPLPEPGSHKNARGSVAVVGGSVATPGSTLLAGEAALRSGAGKLRIATVSGTAGHVATAVPEAAAQGFAAAPTGDLGPADASAIAEFVRGADVVLVGTGFVDPDAADRLLTTLVPELESMVVVDALGSVCVGRGRDLGLSGRGCVLTVNPNELAHVLDRTPDDITADQERWTAEAAGRTGLVVACGGEHKSVATPDGDVYVVPGGGPGLAVSGSGDVYAGIVAGLLARTGDPAQAAVWAGWLHATAGDRLARSVGNVGFLARELLPTVPGLLDSVDGRDRR